MRDRGLRYCCRPSPSAASLAGCPSGQRERTVNPPAQPTLVRTQHLPRREPPTAVGGSHIRRPFAATMDARAAIPTTVPISRQRPVGVPMTAPALAADISDPALAAERAEAADAAEPIDRTEATEPTEPMLAADPMDPIDRMLPWEAMDRNESVDARENWEFAMGELWLPRGDRDSRARGRFLRRPRPRVTCLRSGSRVRPQ